MVQSLENSRFVVAALQILMISGDTFLLLILGHSPGRDDVLRSQTVGTNNIAICDLSKLTDGSSVYITVNGI